MKKTFVTALVVGSCMLASETASAQDSVSSLLSFSPETQEARDAENRRRMLGSKNKNREDTGGDENAENGENEPAEEEPQEQEEQEPEEKEEEEPEEKEEEEEPEEKEEEEPEEEEQEKEEEEDQEKEEEEEQEKEEEEQEEPEEKEEEEEQEPEEKEEDEEQEPEEKEEGEEKEDAGEGEERQYDDDGREVDEDGNPKVQEESVGPGGEEMVDDDDTDPNGEAREQAQEEREQAQEDAGAERDEANDEAAQEKEDAEAEQQDQADAQENEQAEADEKEQADQQEADEQEEKDDAAAQDEKEEADEQEEAEEKDDQAEADEKEEADQEEQEQAEGEEKEEAEAQEQDEADEQEAQEKDDAEAQEKEDAEAEDQEQAEADEKEEAEADEKEQDEADEKEQEEADEKEQEEADDKEQEEADDKEQEEADDKEQEEADDKEQEEADDQEQAEADEKEEADQEENEQAEAEEKEGEGEGEEKEQGEGEEREPEEREEGEEREPAEGEEREDDGEGRARVEEESVGPADDSSNASGSAKGKQAANGQYEGDVVALDEENDPDWYRAHMSTYPCYKLTEGALFNLQLLKNLDQDWHTAGADTKKPTTVYFNLCHYTDTSDCNGNKEDAFAYRTDETGSCEMLTSDSPQAEITEEVTRQSPSDPDTEQRGVRIMRAGGDDCPADNSRLLQFTLDIWCNEDVSRNPDGIKSVSMAPDDDEADPCTIYVNLEHAAGCPELDFEPALNMLGVIMIFFGVTLQYFGRRVQRLFMRFLVSIATFVIVLGICFKLNWLALFDPTEPDSNKSVFLAMFSILLAGVAVTIINFLFKKFLRLAPTFIGLCAGFWFSIYLIAAVNGIGGMFVPAAAAGSKDVIGPVWGAVIEFMVSCLGGLIGYNYSAVFILFIQTFVSAYLIVRGSTLIINLGFPNEIVLMQSVSNETNGLVRLPTSFYLYSATILGLWGGSFYFQLSKEWEDGTLTKFDDDDD